MRGCLWSALLLTAGLVACHKAAPAKLVDSDLGGILLYAGKGTSENDVVAIEKLLGQEKLRFTTIDAPTLDHLTPQQLENFDLLLVPGGNFEVMGNSLAPGTPAHIREAVRGGLNYLGICAGAFMAGDSPYNGINLTGKRFGFYSESARGVRKTVVRLTNGDGTPLETYWEDGPELSGWGNALAKYADGAPAVAQGKVGAGWVVLSGVHLEAPDNWYDGLDPESPAGISNARALKLIRAAMDGEALPYL